VAVAHISFPLNDPERYRKESGAYMEVAFAALSQAAMVIIAAMAADPVCVIAAVQAALSLLRRKAKYIKK